MSRSPELARVGWVDERTLTSADLRDEDTHSRVLRARHLLEAHRTWGVIAGLRPRPVRGEDVVIVTAGLAYDPCGAELVLPQDVRLRIPEAQSEGATLVIRADGCGCTQLAWIAAGEPGLRSGVPLARLSQELGTPQLDRTAMRIAGSRRRPVVLSGSPQSAAWGDFAVMPNSDGARGMTVQVEQPPEQADALPPRYFASVVADPLPEGMALFSSVQGASLDQFTVRVLPASAAGAVLPEEAQLEVVWVSIEIVEVEQ